MRIALHRFLHLERQAIHPSAAYRCGRPPARPASRSEPGSSPRQNLHHARQRHRVDILPTMVRSPTARTSSIRRATEDAGEATGAAARLRVRAIDRVWRGNLRGRRHSAASSLRSWIQPLLADFAFVWQARFDPRSKKARPWPVLRNCTKLIVSLHVEGLACPRSLPYSLRRRLGARFVRDQLPDQLSLRLARIVESLSPEQGVTFDVVAVLGARLSDLRTPVRRLACARRSTHWPRSSLCATRSPHEARRQLRFHRIRGAANRSGGLPVEPIYPGAAPWVLT
jgi:hypothetical protein